LFTPRGELCLEERSGKQRVLTPGDYFNPRDQLHPYLGTNFTTLGANFTLRCQISPLGTNFTTLGANFTLRCQISPLGLKLKTGLSLFEGAFWRTVLIISETKKKSPVLFSLVWPAR
jgi:hypothetical protein